MTRYEKILEVVNNMSDSDLLQVYNNICDEQFYSDDMIYSMDELNELLSGWDPFDIARAIYYGDCCPQHDYFKFNGYGNIESTDFLDSWIDKKEIARHIDEYECAYFNIDLLELFAEIEESEEVA